MFSAAAVRSDTPAPLWTPASLASPPGFWTDRRSTLAIEVTDLVASWGDRSGNARNAVAAGAARPILRGAPWHLEYGPGNRSDIQSAGSLFRAVSTAWMFGVFRRPVPDSSDVSRPFLAWGNNGTAVRVGLYAGEGVSGGANRIGMGVRRLDSDPYAYYGAASPHASGSWVMALGLVNYADRTVSLWINGALDTVHTGAFSGSGTSSNTDSARARLGSNTAVTSLPSFDGDGRVAMAGVGLLSSSEIDKLFGWAAWDEPSLGLADLLPSGHPYKSVAPAP